jgi:hypothetical protein
MWRRYCFYLVYLAELKFDTKITFAVEKDQSMISTMRCQCPFSSLLITPHRKKKNKLQLSTVLPKFKRKLSWKRWNIYLLCLAQEMLPNKGDRNRRNYVATTSERPKLTTETLILVCNKDHNFFFNFQNLFKIQVSLTNSISII